MFVLVSNSESIDIIFLENCEKWLISTKGDRSKLVIIPMLFINFFDVQVGISWEASKMLSCANLTNKSALEHDAVGSSSTFAINAILIIWNR